MNKLDYYPIVTIQESERARALTTKIRKQHTDGVWYTFDVKEVYLLGIDNDLQSIEKQLARFHSNCYKHILFAKIQPEFVSLGVPLYPKDELQISEEERLLTKN